MPGIGIAGLFQGQGSMISEELLTQCETILGYRFKDLVLLKEALTHASIADSRKQSNERLEFLGDSVLGLVVCHRLFELFPDYLEGDLTKLKSAVVSRTTCAAVANDLGITDLLFVGKGMTGRADLPSSLAAGALESIIAAIYVDAGFEAARDFILRCMEPWIQEYAATSHQQNFKSLLQQWAQKNPVGGAAGGTPLYELLDEKGPDHSKCFEVRVVIGNRAFVSAWGTAKKPAEQRAAQNALEELGVLPPSPPDEQFTPPSDSPDPEAPVADTPEITDPESAG
jgi:ribonuclease III